MGRGGDKAQARGANGKARANGLHVVTASDAGEALPNAAEAEVEVLSACVQWPEKCWVQAARRGLNARAFYRPSHSMLWEVISEFAERGEGLEMMSLVRTLEVRGMLEDVGGRAAVAGLWVAAVTDAYFERRLETVLGAASMRALWLGGEKAKEAAMSPDADGLLEIERMQALMRELVSTNRKELSVPVPEEGKTRPRLDVGLPIQKLARELGEILGENGFYRRAETRLVVTVARDGRIDAVTARRLRGAVGEYVYPCGFDKAKEREVAKDLPLETAATLLETDAFLDRLPELRGVARVRQPVWKGGNAELSAPGYDEETGVFCADQVPFDSELTLVEAAEVFTELLGEFEFEDGEAWDRCRSGTLQVALMVGTFCNLLLPSGVPRPMVVYVANQPGAGKTLLACMALAHVHGKIASEDYPPGRSGQEELKKVLDVAAIEQAPVLWFDDVPEYMASHALNRFVTASRHRPRVLGRSEKLDVPAVTQVFATGNHTRVTRDLIRRAVVVELFVPGEIQERTFRQEFTQDLLAKEEWRSKSLAACWALVREWAKAGAPMRAEAPLKGFSDYTSLVGGIMSAALPAGVDPFSEPELPMSGDEETGEMKRLLVAVAEEMVGHPSFESGDVVTLDDVVGVARREQVILVDGKGRDIVGKEGDEPLNAGARKSFGAQLKKWRGRRLKTAEGVQFEFGRRHQDRGQVYPLTFWE